MTLGNRGQQIINFLPLLQIYDHLLLESKRSHVRWQLTLPRHLTKYDRYCCLLYIPLGFLRAFYSNIYRFLSNHSIFYSYISLTNILFSPLTLFLIQWLYLHSSTHFNSTSSFASGISIFFYILFQLTR